MVDIRQADPLDIEPILEHQKARNFLVSLKNVGGENARNMPQWKIDKVVWKESQEQLAKAVDKGNLIVARDGGDVVGYALLNEHHPGKWEIKTLNVHKDMQDKGIGGGLVKRACALAKRRGGEEMRVKPDVMAARFWPKMGYEKKSEYNVRRL